MRDPWFEPFSLQWRVRETSVPQRRTPRARQITPARHQAPATCALHAQRYRRLPDRRHHPSGSHRIGRRGDPRLSPARLRPRRRARDRGMVKQAVKIATKPLLLSHTALIPGCLRGSVVILKYSIHIVGFTWRREPLATKFIWFAQTSNPQWIRGEFAKI